CIPRNLDGIFQQKLTSILEMDVAQTFVVSSQWPVGSFRCRRKPSLIDAAALPAECVNVVRMKFQAPARNEEGSRHPARFQTESSTAGCNCIKNLRLVQHY